MGPRTSMCSLNDCWFSCDRNWHDECLVVVPRFLLVLALLAFAARLIDDDEDDAAGVAFDA